MVFIGLMVISVLLMQGMTAATLLIAWLIEKLRNGVSIVRKSKGIYWTVRYPSILTDEKQSLEVGNKPTMVELVRDIIENSEKYPNAFGQIIEMRVR
jgi:hypothetical protein